MKTLGLLGGMSWESTATYYSMLNRGVRERLGGLASASLLLHSFDFAPIAELQNEGAWSPLSDLLCDAAKRLERGGADALLICTNTMHKLYGEVAAAVAVPVLHIGDATGAALAARGVARPLVLATRFTMEESFLLDRLRASGAAPVTPDVADRARVHAIIYEELCRGVVEPRSKAVLLDIVRAHLAAGADGVVLGCTEIGLILSHRDVDAPVFDTTALHVEAALDFACARPAVAA